MIPFAEPAPPSDSLVGTLVVPIPTLPSTRTPLLGAVISQEVVPIPIDPIRSTLFFGSVVPIPKLPSTISQLEGATDVPE